MEIPITRENVQRANKYIATRGNYIVLKKLNNYLRIPSSNYISEESNSELLLFRYTPYLARLRTFFHEHFQLDILTNLEKFQSTSDESLAEYYELISQKLNLRKYTPDTFLFGRYYIHKIKPFFVDGARYFEVTFTNALNQTSKFDRVIAFTKLDIQSNYSVRLSIRNVVINIMGKTMPIQIIDNWEVSVRPCEFNNIAKILGQNIKTLSEDSDYQRLMLFLTNQHINLVDIIDLSDIDYDHLKTTIFKLNSSSKIFDILDTCRDFSLKQKSGFNVLRYLLLHLNNRIIKQQYEPSKSSCLSDLYLKKGCKSFDEMPYATSLVGHNVRVSDLFECIPNLGREHEVLARYIKNNTEKNGVLFTQTKQTHFDDTNILIQSYNSKVFQSQKTRLLKEFNEYIYINGYAQDCFDIINKISELTKVGIENHSKSVISWLKKGTHKIDCEEKKNAVKAMFENSRVALIYGSAGTGKSYLVNHIAHLYQAQNKLLLANTNPAIDNLKRKVVATGCTYKTIAKLLNTHEGKYPCDLLVIDECSTVSNIDMKKVLEKVDFKLLILVGDVYQIESIVFGNWFDIVRQFVPKSAVFELKEPFRTKNEDLLDLWKKVRGLEEGILECLHKNNYSKKLDASIYEKTEDDQIILCLNYDGLYGINSINSFLQNSNINPAFKWGINTYKVNDPILFNESNRFSPLIFNNLKGNILKITLGENKITFEIEVDKEINIFDASNYKFKLLHCKTKGKSIIRFDVDKIIDEESDENSKDTVVPFQIAYAISIHKAQGIEYNDVKLIITNEIEDMITHNIFYTAITRARMKLSIYWGPGAEKAILNNFKLKDNSRDSNLLKTLYPKL